MSSVREEAVPSESNPDVQYTVRLNADGTTECTCDGWKHTGRCKHIRACYTRWTAEGLIDAEGNVRVDAAAPEPEGQGGGVPAAPPAAPVQAPAAAAPPAAPPAPAAPAPEVWRDATPEEAEAWKYHSKKPDAKKKLPGYVRKIGTDQKDENNFTIMRVEILVGSPADTKARKAEAPAAPKAAVATRPSAPSNGSTVPARVESIPQLEEMRKIKASDFYEVSRYNERTRQYEKMMVPSAKVWNVWSLGDGTGDAISTEYVRDREGKPVVGMNEQSAWAHVRGRRGNVVREASVTIIFTVEQAKLIVDKIKKRFDERKAAKTRGEDLPDAIRYEMDSHTGLPVLLDPEDQIEVISQAYRTRMFGDRMATTKAESIVERKLLGVEFQEEEEQRHEREEVEAVTEAQNQGAPPPVKPQPAGKAAAGVAGKFPEAGGK